MYQCPKEGGIHLHDCHLAPGLEAKSCHSCGGLWIPAQSYLPWQRQQGNGDDPPTVALLPLTLKTTFQPSPLDSRAALCPDCHSYLVRGRLNLRQGTIYLERCPSCQGIWCDGGEWDLCQELGLQAHLDYVFSTEWQAQIRHLEAAERERQALEDRLGPDITQRLEELSDLLKHHDYADFAVAYLMRRCDR
ncbi:MAG: hypothetical protein KGQ93_08145 [Cyanobacteria bacterium REEB459]|nr:hypothetical protein [Cyanobacteria bacterium REEB459]